MSDISTGAVNHIALTVTDKDRAREFYIGVLGFKFVTEAGPKYLLSNGAAILALGQAPDTQRTLANDRFDENRVGLDHVSFDVNSREELEQAAQALDKRGISRGEIEDLSDIYVLAFRDPDNIQLELAAPKS